MAREVKNRLVNRILDHEIEKVAAMYLSGGLIDIGCGNKPYEDLVAPFVRKHVGIELKESPHDLKRIDIFGTAYEIPVKTGSFDCALCTAVLEHLEEPVFALSECYRILRRGGVAIYSVPFIWHLHEEPRDFYRFSKYGLQYVFEKAGFEVLEIRALSGFWVTFGQLLVYNLYRLNLKPFRWLRIVDALGLLIQAISFLLEKIDRTEQWTWMYIVVARK